ARRFDADIEAPVEAAVLCVTGRVAGVGVQHHGANMGLLDPLVSPDSDTLAGGDFTLSRGSPTHVGDGGGDMAKFAAWARPILASITLIAAAVAPATAQTEPMPTAQRPNIVLIVADDVGFTDLGAYGGEARTPNIDSLAQRGAQFSRYYSSPLCSPSRAMLLTGMDNHRTGHSTIIQVLPRELRGRPGYTMRLEPGVVTLATRLQRGGYRTYATGKWHLGHGEGDLPNSHGFDRSFVLDASGADNWEERSYIPYYRTADWFENGARAHLPENFYSSDFIV